VPGERRRSARVTVRLREELARLLQHDLSDPRLTHVILTDVDMTDDLQSARVFVRLELGGDVPAARQALMKGLEAATGRLRSSIARAVGLRYAPTLRFYYDDGLEATLRIEQLLNEISSEKPES